MSGKKLRISIIALLAAVAIASFGCGGGSSTSPAAGDRFTTAVIPDTDSTTGSESSESENAGPGDPPSNEGGDNAPGSSTGSTPGGGGNTPASPAQNEGGDNAPGSSTGSTPGGGGNTPASPAQNAQNTQQSTDNDNQKEDNSLPPGHGLSEDEIMVYPGNSELHGNIIITCPASSPVVCIINVTADGAATYERLAGIPRFAIIPPEGFPDIPWPRPNEAAQAPVFELEIGSILHVGSNVAPQADELTRGIDRNGVSVSYGEVQDGIGSERLLEFMRGQTRFADKIDHTGVGGGHGLETYPEPPTIRLAEGTSDLYAGFATQAVRLINSALPYEKRITLSTETLPTDTKLGDVPEGEIFLEFGSITTNNTLGSARLLSSTQFNSQTDNQEVQKALKAHVTINEQRMREALVYTPSPAGEEPADWWDNWRTIVLDSRVENSDTTIKWYNDKIFLTVVVHELMHALGFYHIDESRFSDSIMYSRIIDGQENVYSPYFPESTGIIFAYVTYDGTADMETTDQSASMIKTDQSRPTRSQGYLMAPDSRAVRGSILFPLDRAALLAAYGRLDPGTQPEELTAENLGAWTDTSFHLRGDVNFPGGGASFGVASSNGLAQPWASGPTPLTNLADNETLSGSATWRGALLGITSSSETVAGDVRLRVGLSSLNGQIDFTGLEKWGVKEAPGAFGSGTTWGDGDLGYTIQVRGNTFIQTGGDDGNVAGAFFGAAHEAMGGVLERADLSASFGGKR